MNNSPLFRVGRRGSLVIAIVLIGAAVSLKSRWDLFAQSMPASAAVSDEDALLEGFRHVEVASVSDALEQTTGRRMYMSHRMQPIFTSKFAGFAVTVKLKRDEGNTDPSALNGMLAAIDQGPANS